MGWLSAVRVFYPLAGAKSDRLLGSYRGLSEAGIGYLRLAEKINWAQWQEARF